MRKTPLIAAAIVAASAAGAQTYGANCRSDTLTELSNCVTRSIAPPVEVPAQETEEVAPLIPRGTGPVSLGGALEPSNLQAAPPLAGQAPVSTLRTGTAADAMPGIDPLGDLRDNPSGLYGLGQPATVRQRSLRFDPLAGTGIGMGR